MNWLLRLLGLDVDYRRCMVLDYYCHTPVRLKKGLKTPCGSKITVLLVCVDIEYLIRNGVIKLESVRLSRNGFRIMGSNSRLNVSSARTGEAWYLKDGIERAMLMTAIQNDLNDDSTRLGQMMIRNWRLVNQKILAKKVADAINAGKEAEIIKKAIDDCIEGVSFYATYKSADGEKSKRHIVIRDVRESLLCVIDLKDGQYKTFKVSQTSDVRPIFRRL